MPVNLLPIYGFSLYIIVAVCFVFIVEIFRNWRVSG